MSAYDDWRTREPMDDCPDNAITCDCGELVQEDEYEEAGCPTCGNKPEEGEDQNTDPQDPGPFPQGSKGGQPCV